MTVPALVLRSVSLSSDSFSVSFAYLNTIPPVYNVVPSPKVPDEALPGLRDAFDQLAADLPQEEWASRSE